MLGEREERVSVVDRVHPRRRLARHGLPHVAGEERAERRHGATRIVTGARGLDRQPDRIARVLDEPPAFGRIELVEERRIGDARLRGPLVEGRRERHGAEVVGPRPQQRCVPRVGSLELIRVEGDACRLERGDDLAAGLALHRLEEPILGAARGVVPTERPSRPGERGSRRARRRRAPAACVSRVRLAAASSLRRWAIRALARRSGLAHAVAVDAEGARRAIPGVEGRGRIARALVGRGQPGEHAGINAGACRTRAGRARSASATRPASSHSPRPAREGTAIGTPLAEREAGLDRAGELTVVAEARRGLDEAERDPGVRRTPRAGALEQARRLGRALDHREVRGRDEALHGDGVAGLDPLERVGDPRRGVGVLGAQRFAERGAARHRVVPARIDDAHPELRRIHVHAPLLERSPGGASGGGLAHGEVREDGGEHTGALPGRTERTLDDAGRQRVESDPLAAEHLEAEPHRAIVGHAPAVRHERLEEHRGERALDHERAAVVLLREAERAGRDHHADERGRRPLEDPARPRRDHPEPRPLEAGEGVEGDGPEGVAQGEGHPVGRGRREGRQPEGLLDEARHERGQIEAHPRGPHPRAARAEASGAPAQIEREAERPELELELVDHPESERQRPREDEAAGPFLEPQGEAGSALGARRAELLLRARG
ncbi:MAG: hypothetical protein R3B82_05325 [Sandaracinaceae bacterium]